MVSTTDQSLTPNAIVEFHAAKDRGKSDAEAWQAAVARIRYDILTQAITVCSLKSMAHEKGGERAAGYADCLHELVTLRETFEGEPEPG